METTTRTWRLGELEVTARGPTLLLGRNEYEGVQITVLAKSVEEFEEVFDALGGYRDLFAASGDVAVFRTLDPIPLRVYLRAPQQSPSNDHPLIAELRKRQEERTKVA